MNIRKKMINSGKCVPPYWTTLSHDASKLYPNCSQREQMKMIYDDISWHTLEPPCRVLSQTTFFNVEFPIKKYDDKFKKNDTGYYFSTSIVFPYPFFKEISQVQSFDIEMLVATYQRLYITFGNK